MVKQNFLRTIFFSVLSVFLFAGASCTFSLGGSSSGDSTINGKTIPVYQGMTVSSTSTVNQRISYANEIDQDNPFNETEENQIEAKLDAFLGADVIDEDFAYFAQASELVRVTINILNPDSFVILSFNLNGVRYQSYEFKEGSNSTRLLMDVPLATDIGVQELTLDEIKYVDGSDIKDAILAGETTVKVGVLYPNLPEVTVSEKTIGTTSLGLDINVTDVNDLIEGAPKPMYAFLYDGQEIIQEELAIGANAIDFTKLHSKTIYQYAIATIFDTLDGNGNVVRIFAKEALRTNAFLSMTLGATKTEITFDITADDLDSIGQIEGVELYHGEALKETILNQATGTFSGLFTNNAYLIKAHFSYQFETEGETFEEVEEQIVTTQANAVPTVSFTDVVQSQEDIVFEYLVTDVDSVGALTKIELIHNSVVVETMTTYDSTMFEGLLSNNDYQLKATYVYDLNDGVGAHTLEVTENVKTLAKATPTFAFVDVVPGQEDIVFEYLVTDVDSVGALTKIELIHNSVVVETMTSYDSTMFEGLLSNNDYQLKATYVYDLDDGVGEHTLEVTAETKTIAKEEPAFMSSGVSSLKKSITLDGAIVDVDNVGNYQAVELFKNDVLVGSIVNYDSMVFADLTKLTPYIVKITYVYDLNDGNGQHILAIQHSISTRLFEVGDGTTLNPYQITNAEDLSDVRLALNSHLLLSTNIDLLGAEWTPIGTSASPFTGTFDGQNCIISNLTITTPQTYVGLFGYSTGTIKNILFSEVNINVTGSLDSSIYCGTLAGYNSGKIENIHTLSGDIYIKVRGGNQGMVGGIVGQQEITDVIYLSNNASIVGDMATYIGGVIGFSNNYNGFISFIENCGNVTSNQGAVGGIIGFAYSPQIIDCSNTGIIVGKSKVGGLVGFAESVTIYKSNNSGPVSGATAAIGGLIGYADTGTTTINESYNSGIVTGESQIGGLVGYTYFYTASVINKSHNSGPVSGLYKVGGLIGDLWSYKSPTIDKAFNYGEISGVYYVGGIIGYGISPNTLVSNSYNGGQIVGDFFVGGLFGQIYDTATISNSYNIGQIRGKINIGGLAGYVGNLLYCYYSVNLGDVAAINDTEEVGGITGYLPTANDLEHVYFTGSVTSNGVEVSGIAFGTKVADLSTLDLAFFTTTLGWSTEVWDFTGLDVASGAYPELII